MISSTFRNRIDEAHSKSGLSLRQLSEVCDVDYSYISRILSGQRKPTRDVVITLAVYGWNMDRVETDELLIAGGYQPLGRSTRR